MGTMYFEDFNGRKTISNVPERFVHAYPGKAARNR